jgi:NAD(P)H-hydrate repair Nnr-like enzyme with NAD(P)H-hydrate dehydratase domain
LTAGAAGAWLHADAASRGPSRGFVAGDLLAHLPDALAALG